MDQSYYEKAQERKRKQQIENNKNTFRQYRIEGKATTNETEDTLTPPVLQEQPEGKVIVAPFGQKKPETPKLTLEERITRINAELKDIDDKLDTLKKDLKNT